MSDDLRDLIAKALSRSVYDNGALRDYLDADAVLAVIGPRLAAAERLAGAARAVEIAYQEYLDTDDLDVLRDALTAQGVALAEWDAAKGQR